MMRMVDLMYVICVVLNYLTILYVHISIYDIFCELNIGVLSSYHI